MKREEADRILRESAIAVVASGRYRVTRAAETCVAVPEVYFNALAEALESQDRAESDG